MIKPLFATTIFIYLFFKLAGSMEVFSDVQYLCISLKEKVLCARDSSKSAKHNRRLNITVGTAEGRQPLKSVTYNFFWLLPRIYPFKICQDEKDDCNKRGALQMLKLAGKRTKDVCMIY